MMHVSILTIDDDPIVKRLLTAYFFKEKYSFHAVSGLIEARELIATKYFNIVIVDINLIAENGLDLVSELRSKREKYGIIILSSNSAITDKIIGLEVGADDYISKPFEPRELMVRIKRLAERVAYGNPSTSHHNSNQILAFDNLRIEVTYRKAYSNGHSIQLTSKEFDLLVLLAKNYGKTLSRDQISMVLNGRQSIADDRSIAMLVKRLRNKLTQPHLGDLIQNVRGAGYVFTRYPINQE